MSFGIKTLGRFLRRFRKKDDGGPTIEFVLMFMPIMVITMTGMELGLLMTRHVMLERGMTMATRHVALNTGAPVDEDQYKQWVCNSAGLIPNCMTNLRLEMRPIDLRDPSNSSNNGIPREASCTDIDNPFEPARNFTPGAANQLMVVRACALFKPMLLPGLGVGAQLNQSDQGVYRLVTSTAFVMEPI